jgi:hypothetical protein
MKPIVASLLVAAGIAGPLVSHLAAQTNREVAYVPFAFVAGNQKMPAGRYVVDEAAAGSPLFRLTDDRRHTIFVPFSRAVRGNPERPSLTFACYGKECILAKVTPPVSMSAYELSQQSIDKKISHKVGVVSMIAIRLTDH